MNDLLGQQVLDRLGIEVKEGEGLAWMYSHYISYLCYSERIDGYLHTVSCDLCKDPNVLARLDPEVLTRDGKKAIRDRLWVKAGGNPTILNVLKG